MFLFTEIYEKAFGLFKDPKLNKAYKVNKIQFCKAMYSYLQNAITLFDNPAVISNRLMDYSEPVGTLITFTSDGSSTTYQLDEEFIIRENSIYSFTGDGATIDGSIDVEGRTVTFSEVIPEGKEYTMEQYSVGKFNDDFSETSRVSTIGDKFVENKVKDILARLIVKVWAEGERNDLLDIRNIMQDSEFKRTDNSRILASKNNWVDQLDTEISQLQNELAWHIRFMKNSTNMGRG